MCLLTIYVSELEGYCLLQTVSGDYVLPWWYMSMRCVFHVEQTVVFKTVRKYDPFN